MSPDKFKQSSNQISEEFLRENPTAPSSDTITRIMENPGV